MTITTTRVDSRDFGGERISNAAANVLHSEYGALREMSQMLIGKCFLEALSLTLDDETDNCTFIVEEWESHDFIGLDNMPHFADLKRREVDRFPTARDALSYMQSRATEIINEMLAADPEQRA